MTNREKMNRMSLYNMLLTMNENCGKRRYNDYSYQWYLDKWGANNGTAKDK